MEDMKIAAFNINVSEFSDQSQWWVIIKNNKENVEKVRYHF